MMELGFDGGSAVGFPIFFVNLMVFLSFLGVGFVRAESRGRRWRGVDLVVCVQSQPGVYFLRIN